MPRLKLTARGSYPFSIEIQVRITDLNYGGHLGNDRVLSLIHEARAAFLAAHGYTEMDCGGVSLTMADAALVYRGEAFYGDTLRVEVAAGEAGKKSFRLFYRVTRPADEKEIALAETGMVCFDYQNRKIANLPDQVGRMISD